MTAIIVLCSPTHLYYSNIGPDFEKEERVRGRERERIE